MTRAGRAGDDQAAGPQRTAEPQPAAEAVAVLRAMPKVELHLHLDCCLSYEAAAKLSPGLTRGQYEQDFTGPDRVNGLTDFLSRTLNHVALLQTRDGLVTCVEDLAAQLERDNVIYAELRFAPAQHTRLGLATGEVVQIVAEAIEALRGSSPVTMRLLLCSLWHLPLADSLAVLDLVERFRPAGTVAGFDIAGNDAHPEKRLHYPALRRARDRGIPLTVHAGEAGPGSDVDETLRLFAPARIGHGVHAAGDPDLVGRLAVAGTHLEICPSCNVQLGLYPRLAAHPLPVLYERGVSVGISTDQRSVTPTTLTREYARVAQAFPSWGQADFTACNVNAARASFADERTKAAILDRL